MNTSSDRPGGIKYHPVDIRTSEHFNFIWQEKVHDPVLEPVFTDPERGEVCLPLPAGAKARALKLQLLEVKPRNSKSAWISELSVWGRPPTKPFETLSDVPPVSIPCNFAVAGEAALVVEDANGRRVRNLFAQVERQAKLKKGDVRVGRAHSQLGFWAGAARYEVKEFLPDGTPVYELRSMPFAANYHMPDGNHFRFGRRNGFGVNEVVTPQGRTLWFYPASHGMDGLNVPPWQPGRVDLQFGIAGFGKVQGDLGDIFVIAANNGQWNLWTCDGLLAGHLTLHTRDPRLKGWPAEHARGTKMENITAGQEHFHYFFTQAADGKFYLIAGGMNTSVMEVQGLERIRRGEVKLTVTPEMLRQTRDWESQRQTRKLFTRAPVQECLRGAPCWTDR